MRLGLLTDYEALVLENDADRAHEIVNSWVAMEMSDGSRKDGIFLSTCVLVRMFVCMSVYV